MVALFGTRSGGGGSVTGLFFLVFACCFVGGLSEEEESTPTNRAVLTGCNVNGEMRPEPCWTVGLFATGGGAIGVQVASVLMG